jgi:hypothetical protein
MRNIYEMRSPATLMQQNTLADNIKQFNLVLQILTSAIAVLLRNSKSCYAAGLIEELSNLRVKVKRS